MVTSLSRNGASRLNVERSESVAPNSMVNVSLPKTPLFGTDGIRGKAGDLLTASFALQLGLSAGQVLQELSPLPGPIIIGQDSRNSSDMLTMAITNGLTAAGLEVWQLGLCPTPCVAHLTRITEASGGIMISASHNPPEDNGIKFFSHQGTKISPAIASAIETRLREIYQPNNPPLSYAGMSVWGKHYQRSELTENYAQGVLNSLPPAIDLQGLKIVLDLAWGASVKIAPSLFKALGAKVICLHDQPDGDRINVNCGSTHLHRLKTTVRETGANLGFAFDGDADRVMAVDAQGRVVDGDYILYLWGQALQQRQQLPDNLIIGTVMANLGFERAWKQLGGKLIRTAVGDQYVQAQMWETGAMLGGEQSGHIICHHHGVSGDGVQTALHLAVLVRQAGIPLDQLVDNSFQTYPQILRNVRVEDREKRSSWQNCEPLQQAISKAETEMGEQGRILVRASGTEPLVRVMVESESAEAAAFWTEYLVGFVQQHLT
jgi:phosphoglucosamine mutase